MNNGSGWQAALQMDRGYIMLFREYPGRRRKDETRRIKEGRVTEDGQGPVAKNVAF